jgi:hypothetical protein
MTIQEKAFPNPHLTHETGMTMRDYFAAKAMQSLIMGIEGGKEHQFALVPKTSYAMADAMMEARK